jgi:hypothetical protein
VGRLGCAQTLVSAYRRKRQAVTHNVDYATSKEDGQVSNESDEDPEWTTKEWKILGASDNISDSDEASDDDGKPRFQTKPSRCKTKWSSNLGQRQVKHHHAPKPEADPAVQVS